MKLFFKRYGSETPSLTHLFLSFLRLGVTAFGGPAMVAYIRKLAVEKNHWIGEQDARDGVALCQTIPGATAMQLTAYVGFRVRGVAGAAISFIGFGLPAVLFMIILSALYIRTHALPSVISVFNGLQVIIVAIVAVATLSFGKVSIKTWKNAGNALIAAALFALKVNPIMVIIICALLGMIFYGRESASVRPHPAYRAGIPRSFFLILSGAIIVLGLLYLLDQRLFDLAVLMSKIDIFAFGGGLASIPLMFHEVVEVRFWMDGLTFLNGIALGQVTPGPIVITATFIGYLLYGLFGGLIASIFVFLPSFMMVVGIIPYFDRLRNLPYFKSVTTGILCSFAGLLLIVTMRFALDIPWDLHRILLGCAAFVALVLKIDILWVILSGAAISTIIL